MFEFFVGDEERERLIGEFKNKGFQSNGVTPQNDFYIEAKPSPFGTYDLKRYRIFVKLDAPNITMDNLIIPVQVRKY